MKDKTGNEKDVLLSGDISIPREYCTFIKSDNGITTFHLKKFDLESRTWVEDNILASTYIEIKQQTPKHLVMFGDENNTLTDSGCEITDEIDLNKTDAELKSTIPSTYAVIQHIDDVSRPLDDAVNSGILPSMDE